MSDHLWPLRDANAQPFTERLCAASTSAPVPCTICKSQKRKCDRRLPQCNRCRKLLCSGPVMLDHSSADLFDRQGRHCHYTEVVSHQFSRPHQQPIRIRYRLPYVVGPANSSVSSANSTEQTLMQTWLQPRIIDQQITCEVLGLLNRSPTDFNDVVDTMQDSVYPWLAILNVASFRRKVHQLSHEPNAEVATLLLAVHLMNYLSTPIKADYPKLDGDIQTDTCRRFFTILQLDRKDRIETIQSGVFLSALELHAGRFNEASLTITTCAKLGHQFGLDRCLAAAGKQTSEQDTIRRNMWYGLVLMDR